MRITCRLEFDSGHRIPDHESQCRHVHGHRYAMEITVEGDILNRPGDPAHGMVMDFSRVKALAREHVVDRWDHAFLVWREDRVMVDFLASLPGHRTVILDTVPTVENLAAIAFDCLAPVYREAYGNALQLYRIRLFETPNCSAEIEARGLQAPI